MCTVKKFKHPPDLCRAGLAATFCTSGHFYTGSRQGRRRRPGQRVRHHIACPAAGPWKDIPRPQTPPKTPSATPATAASERADWLRRRRCLPHSALWTPETAVTGQRWLRRWQRLPNSALWTPETAVTGRRWLRRRRRLPHRALCPLETAVTGRRWLRRRRLPRLSQKTAATPCLPGGWRPGRLTACGCAKNRPQ
jgi:hypothetical protein